MNWIFLRLFSIIETREKNIVVTTKNRVKKTYSLPFIFITEAKWIQKWLKEKFNQESNYVPNALNTAIIHKVETVEPRKTNKIRILLEGGIDIEYKGMEDAFSAVQDLDCEIWCVSNSGKPKDKWKCDKFFENVPFNRMKEIYSSCDILLKMSRIEGFFGPPLEMMVCGGCCVVAKVTGYDEYIIDGFNALVVEERDIEGAKKAVQRLMADPELRQKIILNGLETAKMWSDWEKSIDLLERLYLS